MKAIVRLARLLFSLFLGSWVATAALQAGLLLPLQRGNFTFFIIIVVVFLMAISLHEFSHAWMATWLGDPTPAYEKRLTVNPFAHLDLLGTLLLFFVGFGWGKPVPFNPYQLRNRRFGPAMVALAGPAANLVIAVIFASTYRLLQGALIATPLSLFFQAVITLNLALFLFNLIPIPPLDGSKVFFALLPEGANEFKVSLERYGPFILIALIFVIARSAFPIVIEQFILFFGRIFGIAELFFF